MINILLIDQGNTRAKYAVCQLPDPDKLISRVDRVGAIADSDARIRVIEIGELSNFSYQAIYIAAVGPLATLPDALPSDVPITYLTTPKSGYVVDTVYNDYQTLGVDRWLAYLAAYQHYQSACVVVDFGTALTIDVVNQQGKHQGGYILPGYKTSIQALLNNTDRLTITDIKAKAELGTNTQACILNGIVNSHISLIKTCIKTEQLNFENVICILTGGDSEKYFDGLAQQKINYRHHEKLVFEGMVHCIAYDLANKRLFLA